MTIRFGNQVRLASRDRFRQMLLIDRDPGDIVSFAELQALMQRHRAQVRGVSRDAEFLRWLMYREGSGTGCKPPANSGCFLIQAEISGSQRCGSSSPTRLLG